MKRFFKKQFNIWHLNSSIFQTGLRCPNMDTYGLGAGVFGRNVTVLRRCIQLCNVCIMFLKEIFKFLRDHDCFENFTGCAPLWSTYFGRSENMALESSDMTGWALTSAFRVSPAVPHQCVYALNSALNLGQCSVGILTFRNDKWQGF